MYFKQILAVGGVLFLERVMQSFLDFKCVKGGSQALQLQQHVRCLGFGHKQLCAGQLVQRQKLHPTVSVVLQYIIYWLVFWVTEKLFSWIVGSKESVLKALWYHSMILLYCCAVISM